MPQGAAVVRQPERAAPPDPIPDALYTIAGKQPADLFDASFGEGSLNDRRRMALWIERFKIQVLKERLEGSGNAVQV